MTTTAGLPNVPASRAPAQATVAPEDRARTIRAIVTYLVLTIVFSAILWRPMLAAHTLAPGGSGNYVLILMWCPAAAGLSTRFIFYRSLRGVGWGKPRAWYAWAGYWIPIAYGCAVYVPLWLAGYSDFHAAGIQQVLGRFHLAATPSGLRVLAYIAIVGTVGLIPECFAALGEEIGWRGFLVPELAKVTSFGWVGLMSGAIWAAWHVPLIVAADYHGDNPVWYSLVCFGIMVIGAGYLAAWIRLKSGSVWPAMLLHGSHNLFIQSIFDPLTRRAPVTNYMTTEFGAGLAIASAVIACLVWRSFGRTASPPQ